MVVADRRLNTSLPNVIAITDPISLIAYIPCYSVPITLQIFIMQYGSIKKILELEYFGQFYHIWTHKTSGHSRKYDY